MNFKNKNVLLIIHQGYLGGAERQGLSLSKVLTEEFNCNVYLLLTYSDEMTSEFKEFAKECKVKEIFHFGTPYFLIKKELTIKNLKRLKWSFKYLFKVRRGLKSIKPDIIIPFLNFPSKISYYLYKLLPSVKHTFWHQLGLDKWSDDILEKIAAQNTPLIIANAPNGIEIFNEKYPRSLKDCYVLPQFASIDYIAMDRDHLRRKYNIADNTIVIGMIAHYRPEKLHHLLFESFIRINKEIENIKLVFLGNESGEKVIELKKAVRSRDLNDKVFVLSNSPVHEILNLLDIGVLVSEIEGTPNAVMEYMIYGLPVVCTDHPGCRLLLKDSRFLVNNDIENLDSSLKQLLNSKELRLREGRENLKKIEAFNKFNYIENLEVILSRTQS